MNKQDVFDRVARHLLTQNRKSWLSTGQTGKVCAYHGDEGVRCAAGIFIDDEHYSPEMEGVAVPRFLSGNDPTIAPKAHLKTPLIQEALLAAGIEDDHLLVLRQLQAVHDQVPVESWRTGLAAVAKDFALSDAVLGEFPVTRDRP